MLGQKNYSSGWIHSCRSWRTRHFRWLQRVDEQQVSTRFRVGLNTLTRSAVASFVREGHQETSMHIPLKPLADQIIVVTGATSGHGLSTARKAAAKGARVMLAARDEGALRSICTDIQDQGGAADYVVVDVGSAEDVSRLASQTISRFGGIDTWINNAGVGVYATAIELDLEDHRQVFETNYWGVVHGSVAALKHFRDQNTAGSIINVGSINGDMGTPLLSSYNASKHAVKGFTDSLRIEVIEAGWPVSVTLIKPSAIGTPFPEHGRNLTGFKARLPRPMYSPEVVADAILDAARHPRRSVTVGGAGKLQVLGATIFPSVFDRLASLMRPTLIDRQKPVGLVAGSVYKPQGNNGRVEGDQKGRSFSTFTSVRRHQKIATTLMLLALGGAAVTARRVLR